MNIDTLIPSYIENSSRFYVIATDLEGKYIYTNRAFKNRYSFITNDFIGKPSAIAVHPDDMEKCNDAVARVLANPDIPVQVELRKPEIDPYRGVRNYMVSSWEFSLLKDEAEGPVGILCIGSDISEYVRTRIRNSSIIQSLPDLVLVVNKEQRFVDHIETRFNPLVPPAEFLGKTVDDVFPGELSKLTKDALAHTLHKNQTYVDQYTLPDDNGDLHFYELWVVPYDVEEAIFLVRDITEREQFRRETERMREYLNKLTLQAPGIFYVLQMQPDRETKLLYVSESAFNFTGVSARELILKPSFKDDLMFKGDHEKYDREKLKSFQMLAPFTFEFRLAADPSRYMQANSLPTKNSDESVTWYGFISEVTLEKRRNYELQQSLDVIGMQNRRLMEFTYIVSHNLRSHSANIQGIVELCKTATTPADMKEYVSMMDKVNNGLMKTLDHLNMLLQVQDEVGLQKEFLNLHEIVNEAIDVLAIAIKDSGGSVINEVDDSLDVRFIPAYLDSIIINLISNALKYRDPDRTLEVKISAVADQTGVFLKVKDNGLGIDMQKVGERVFEMYQTFHEHPKARGLGLYLIRSQVEAGGGSIKVDSNPGDGSEFTVHFPSKNRKEGLN